MRRAHGVSGGESSYCTVREGRIGMCWISGNAVCRSFVLMIKAVLPILTAGRQRA